MDPKATIFREHADRQIEDPIFVFAEQIGDVADREDCTALADLPGDLSLRHK